jgi:hypothetical protein
MLGPFTGVEKSNEVEDPNGLLKFIIRDRNRASLSGGTPASLSNRINLWRS